MFISFSREIFYDLSWVQSSSNTLTLLSIAAPTRAMTALISIHWHGWHSLLAAVLVQVEILANLRKQ